MRVSVIIPSLNPDDKLLRTVEGLAAVGFDDIIVVNDGSDAAHEKPFEELSVKCGVTVLRHEVNRGKGRALKTAFEYCLQNRQDSCGVVTADGDNQHTPTDILACAKKMIELGEQIILGVRDFSQPDVPWKSRTGNRITSGVFKLACGMKISDTQTGLRAIPQKYLEVMTEVQGERFEYETEMLLVMQRKRIPFTEVKIETVYINENETSHFHPLRDSVLIYRKILKYMLSSLISSLADFLVYSGVVLVIGGLMSREARIFTATLAARILSSLLNFLLNKKAVFHSDAPVKRAVFRYYLLCVCQLGTSWLLVWLFSELFAAAALGEIFLKIPVDVALFFVSYQIQKRWVFRD